VRRVMGLLGRLASGGAVAALAVLLAQLDWAALRDAPPPDVEPASCEACQRVQRSRPACMSAALLGRTYRAVAGVGSKAQRMSLL
jgi:hypothetical protein